MYTIEQLNQIFDDVKDYTSNVTEIFFTLGDMQFELKRTGLLTLLRTVNHSKKECHFKINTIDDLKLAIKTIDYWIDDWYN